MQPWRVLESRRLLERRWLVLHEQRVALPSGVEIEEFHLIEQPDWVGVLALTDRGQVVLVEQYRHGAARSSRELPAGVIDTGETPLEAGKRELLEETGYAATAWQPLITLYPDPSRHTHRAHWFFARNARPVAPQQQEPSENIRVELISPEALMKETLAGEIVHGIHVAAVLLASKQGLLLA